ncbi:MAG: HAMP domain-containing histidine kinase [Granulosicoccus sp.]|nr:HAMP domain-containing histidine kinase [Granulosicoccus sp.]
MNLLSRSSFAPTALCVGLLAVASPALGFAPKEPLPWDYAYFAFAATSIGFFSIAMVMLRAYLWLSYSIIAALLVVLMASVDGTLAYMLSRSSRFVREAPLFFGAVTAAAGFTQSAYLIDPGSWLKSLSGPLYLLAVSSLLLISGYWLVDNLDLLYVFLNVLLLLMLASTVLPPLSWPAVAPLHRRLAVWTPAMFLVFILGLYLVDFMGAQFDFQFRDRINRIAVLAYLLYGMGFALVYLHLQSRATRKAEQEVEIAARKAVEDELKLKTAQHDFEKAARIAHSRHQQLREASHDIRQPVAALRHAVTDLKNSLADKHSEQLVQIIDYLDQLAASYVHESPKDGLSDHKEVLADENGNECVSTRLLTDTVFRLHHKEAQSGNVRLTVHDEGYSVNVQPLILVRLLSNLVANALKHAQASEIDISTLSSSDTVDIKIRDNGIGIPADLIRTVMESGVKGENSDGSGLGLSIVASQAKQHGWLFSIDSMAGAGTCACLQVTRVGVK